MTGNLSLKNLDSNGVLVIEYHNFQSLFTSGDEMEKDEFRYCRKELGKTQKQMAQLLGSSLKAVHSYEQGWRKVPVHVERHLYFLITRRRNKGKRQRACWLVKKCPPEQKKNCPAWEFRAGTLCWFINGTVCCGCVQENWKEKMKLCRTCEVLPSLKEEPTDDQEYNSSARTTPDGQ